jgi:hypothetical protein
MNTNNSVCGEIAMPMHDWTRVKAGTYHNFHYRWVAAIMDRLNAGLLPSGFFAMAEQVIGGPEADVVALRTGVRSTPTSGSAGGVAVAPAKPQTRFVWPMPSETQRYARRANRIAIHHSLGHVVAVIEIVSPGNKDRLHSVQTFVSKAVELLEQQISLLLIDPFPPGAHDPQGTAKAVCEVFSDPPFTLPPDKQLTVAAFQAEPLPTAYIEPFAVNDTMPDMPLFLEGEWYITVPLEETYLATWNVLPMELRQVIASPTAS